MTRRRLLLLAAALVAVAGLAVLGVVLTREQAGAAALYQQNCVACHGGVVGGSMMDWPPRHNASGHTWHHPDCELREVVKNGSREMGEAMRRMMNVPKDAPRMPAFRDKLSDEQIDLVLAYIKTWWTEEQRRYQADVTRQVC